MRHLLVPLATAAVLFGTTTIAVAETGTSPGAQFQSERTMLMDTQMDKVKAGVSPWKMDVNRGGQASGCGGGNPTCTTVKNNPSPNN
jgi:hypothetical protein